ncbi:hypothetical protein ACFSMW_17990 [Virgibacillus halophilus]|uniref:DUF3311 domain-containing protein n=1 Tax=Tigheibacillus halophilus TaxID=361280 RepID=A0ABU5C2U7_9BACI|nr:hypothetical protein [Virgibacillus halophilus]
MKQKKEPIKNWKIWVVLVGLFVLSVPWYLPTGSYEPLIFGVPYWAWIIIGISLIISAALSYILRNCWHMTDEDEMWEEGEEQ